MPVHGGTAIIEVYETCRSFWEPICNVLVCHNASSISSCHVFYTLMAYLDGAKFK